MQDQERIDMLARLAALDKELEEVRRGLSAARPRAQLPCGTFQAVCVLIGNDEFGILSDAVREVVRYAHLLRLPGAPRTVDGALNLRGEIVPVVSVPRTLGLSEVRLDRKTPIVIVRVEGRSVGLLVDRVVDVATFDGVAIEDSAGALMDSRFICGMARSANRFVQLLALDEIALPMDLGDLVNLAETSATPIETPLHEPHDGSAGPS